MEGRFPSLPKRINVLFPQKTAAVSAIHAPRWPIIRFFFSSKTTFFVNVPVPSLVRLPSRLWYDSCPVSGTPPCLWYDSALSLVRLLSRLWYDSALSLVLFRSVPGPAVPCHPGDRCCFSGVQTMLLRVLLFPSPVQGHFAPVWDLFSFPSPVQACCVAGPAGFCPRSG